MKRIDYIGAADIRVITAANLLQAGFVSPDLVWNKQNNFELDVEDDIASWLLAVDRSFVTEPATTYGDTIAGEAVVLRSPLGNWTAMGVKNALVPSPDNTTGETTLLTAPFSMPRVAEDMVFRVKYLGLFSNNSGGPVNLTMRLKNLTDAVAISTALTLTAIPSDAATARTLEFTVEGEGNTFFTLGWMNIARVKLGKGNTDVAREESVGNLSAGPGTDPQNWDLTAQFSVANDNIQISGLSAQIEWAFKGVPA